MYTFLPSVKRFQLDQNREKLPFSQLKKSPTARGTRPVDMAPLAVTSTFVGHGGPTNPGHTPQTDYWVGSSLTSIRRSVLCQFASFM